MQPKCGKKWHQNSQNDCHSDSVTIDWNKREIKITYSHTHVPVVGVVATKLCWDITLLFAFTLTGLYPAKKRTRKQIKMLACFCLQSSSRASRRRSNLSTIKITWMTFEWIFKREGISSCLHADVSYFLCCTRKQWKQETSAGRKYF